MSAIINGVEFKCANDITFTKPKINTSGGKNVGVLNKHTMKGLYINTPLMLSLAPLFATKTFITTFIKTPSCSSSVTNTFCFFRLRGRLRSAHTIQTRRDERFFSMGAMVSKMGGTKSSFSNTKTNYSFTNEKKRERGGGKKKTLTTIVSAAQAAKSNDDNDDN